MGAKRAILILAVCALGACGRDEDDLDRGGYDRFQANNATNATAGAAPSQFGDPNNPDRHDPVIGLIGTEQAIGAVNPDCAQFPPATGPNSVLGLTPGMTLPQATSTLRCQFRGLRHAEARDIWAHSFAGVRGQTGPIRMSFSVIIPGSGAGPDQEVNVYLAGLYNRERVFAIRTEAYYSGTNQLPVATVTGAITQKYGPLVPEREDVYPIALGLASPDPFCLGLIGVAPLNPSNGAVNDLNMPWDRLGACGRRLYVQLHQRDGLAQRMQLMLIDFSILPGLHAQEVAAFEQAIQQAADAEVRRAQENAKQGGAPQL